MALCVALTKSGIPCSAYAMLHDEYCYRHNPNIAASEKMSASISGGKKRQVLHNAQPVTLRSVESIIRLIESNTNAVRNGDIDTKVSNAVIQNVNALLKVYELAIIDSRVRKLEQHAGVESPSELISWAGN